jgi:Methyltransferase domain
MKEIFSTFIKTGVFESGDAKFLYNGTRYFEPRRIIGNGQSTLLTASAIQANRCRSDPNYHCTHICIEPYGNRWLEQPNIELVRSRVEQLDTSFFGELKENDISFIDSWHMIRPQGDVLFECLVILPILKSGVLVHVHDIFTPKITSTNGYTKTYGSGMNSTC